MEKKSTTCYRIFAIDPGNTMSAWCEFRDGVLGSCDKVSNAELLARLYETHADVVAIEMIASYGMPVGREVFETCLWIGRFIEACESRGVATRLVYRKDVKVFHCSSARATDANIRASLLDRYGPGRELAVGTRRVPGPLYGIKGDEWSALAIALFVAEKRSNDAEKKLECEMRGAAAEREGTPF